MAPRTTPQDPERQLMIKTKACQRLAKEAIYYKKEVKENQDKLEKMKQEKKDPHDIKKFEEVLGESYMMVPDSQERLKKSLEDLALFLHGHDNVGGEWRATAQVLLEEHNMSVKDASDEVQETEVGNLNEGEVF